jgi:hypothetical protein
MNLEDAWDNIPALPDSASLYHRVYRIVHLSLLICSFCSCFKVSRCFPPNPNSKRIGENYLICNSDRITPNKNITNGLYTTFKYCESISPSFEANEQELVEIEGGKKKLSKLRLKMEKTWHEFGLFGRSVSVGSQYLEFDSLAV